MSRNTSLIAWSALVLAALAWTGVGLFALRIQAEQQDIAAHATELEHQSSQSSKTSYIHALVADSATARGELEALASVDPASLADTISTAGKSAGVSLQISNATQESALPADGKAAMQSLDFSVTAQGSFSSAMYAAELLETLPVPSSIEEIQLTHAPTVPGVPSESDSWQMNAQLQVLSAPSVSS